MRAVVLRVGQEGQDAETAVHAAACFSSVLPSTNRSGLPLGRSTPQLPALLPLPGSRRHWPRPPPLSAEGDSTERPIAISFSHALRVEALPSGLELPFRALGFQFWLCGGFVIYCELVVSAKKSPHLSCNLEALDQNDDGFS